MEYTFGTIADIPALIDMRTAYILEDFGKLSPEDEAVMRKTLPDYFSEHLNRDCIAFLAKDGETVVSVALLMILQKPCHPKMIHGKMGEVLSVYTLPAYRRQGIAQHNMQRLVDYARASGLDYVNLCHKSRLSSLSKSWVFRTAIPLYRDADSVNKNRIFVQM